MVYAELSKEGQQALTAQRAPAMQPAHAALAARHYAPFKVVCVGDSITEGEGASARSERWIERLRDNLRARFPTTGLAGGSVGYLAAYSSATTFADWFTPTGTVTESSSYGLGRRMVIIDPGASISITVIGTSFDLHCVQNSGRGTMTVAVDGSTVGAVNLNGSRQLLAPRYTLGAAGTSHTVTIAASTAATWVEGIQVYDGDETKGIHVYDSGHSGWTTTSWLAGGTQVDNWAERVGMVDPQLVVIALGTNDYGTNASKATVKANLETLITKIRTAVGDPSFVLLPYAARAGTYTGATWADIVAAHHEIAAADSRVTTLDLSTRIPGASGDTLGLYADTVHPSRIGHGLIADTLASFLAPS